MVGSDPHEDEAEGVRPMSADEHSSSLRPVLFALLQSGGVPSQLAEGISDILEEAGYQSFRETDTVRLNRRKAHLLKGVDPERNVDQLLSKDTHLASSSKYIAAHRRIEYERLAHNNVQTKTQKNCLILTEKMRVA